MAYVPPANEEATAGSLTVEDGADQAAISMTARRGGLIAAALIAVVGLLFVWQSLALAFGKVTLPGPGFFPLVLGLLLIAFSATVFLGQLRCPPDGAIVALGHRNVLVVAGAMLAAPVLFEPLGAYATLGLFSAVLLAVVGRVRVIVATPAAALMMVGCFYFFQVLLGVQLPKGPF